VVSGLGKGMGGIRRVLIPPLWQARSAPRILKLFGQKVESDLGNLA
jgi:hypothetical protein